jgi:ABC-2 type transport system ATP-binding protein
VIDDGRVIAEGTSDQLKAQIGGHRVEVALVEAGNSAAAREILTRFGAGEPTVTSDGRGLEVAVTDGPFALQHVLAALGAAGIGLHDAGMRRPTLDDVFLTLTGHKADTAADTADGAEPEKAR